MTNYETRPHTVDDADLASLAAGTLSPFQQLLLNCQAEMRPDVSASIMAGDHIGGTLLESAVGSELSDDFMARLSNQMWPDADQAQAAIDAMPKPANDMPDWMPSTLANYCTANEISLKWSSVGRNLKIASLIKDPSSGERLYLLKGVAGYKVPKHSHAGQEWTLVLTGGYHSGGQGYSVGDLHQEDEDCTHDLQIDDDGECISLITDQGRLKYPSLMLRLLQPCFPI